MPSMRPCALVFLLVLAAGCTLSPDELPPPETINHAPVVSEIRRQPSRLHRGEQGRLTALASDEDRDQLFYRWHTSRGRFPFRFDLPTVDYVAPATGTTDTVTVVVTDDRDSTRKVEVLALADLAGPTRLGAISGPTWVDLRWEPSRDEDLYDFLGYEVYAAPTSFTSIPEPEWPDYLVNEHPRRDDRYVISGLSQGRIYYFQARAVRGTGERSAYGGQVDAAPRPQGLGVQLREIAYPYASLAQGFDFSEGRRIEFDPGEPASVEQVDLYVGTSDPRDGSGALALKSPEHLAYRHPAWSSRDVGLKLLGTEWTVSGTDTAGFSSQVLLLEGSVVAVRLPEGHYAKFQATDSLDTSYPFRSIQYRWAYQTIPGYPRF